MRSSIRPWGCGQPSAWRFERNEFRLFYQPIVDLSTQVVREVEALIRWDHPTRGIVDPVNFIPLAEETGLIMPLGQWVLREACRQIRDWQQQHPTEPPLRVSVNLSPRQFRDPRLVESVAEILSASGLDPACLNLEITEGATMDDTEAAIQVLHRLKALGVGIAIDDFGTGYSSLAYLKRFPIDTLKVDKVFVDGLRHDDQGSDAIIRAVLMFAQSMHLNVTGEGIETVEQLEELKLMGCQQGQGYYFARPLSSEAMETMLTEDIAQRNGLAAEAV
jgi:EAL domain-containing protein (putative c-di-GMP-specific phosphodiesterase class I)